jgi:hypothetical protein
MIPLKLPPFNPLANGQKATTMVQPWQMTLGRVLLCFPQAVANAWTIATISEIVVKVGSRVVFGPITGTELDKLNKYRGIYNDTGHLTIDLTERDGLSIVAKELGGIDLPALGSDNVFIEVTNNYAGANAHSLYAIGGFTALQFDPRKPAIDGQLIHKLLCFQIPGNGGTQLTWMPDFKGAIVKRVHFSYAGTDWTSTADGNITNVQTKKNGIEVFNARCLDNRFLLNEQRKVPQAKFFSQDFIADNVHSAALETRDARSLEWNLTLTATDTVKAMVEVLDVPGNL